MPSFFTPNRHGYGVKFSPFAPNQIVVSASQYYGLAGGGTLYFLELTNDGIAIKEKQQFHWKDGLFDVAWSEAHPLMAVSASGDGSLQMWSMNDLSNNNNQPQMVYNEHEKEIYSVDWCKTRLKQQFLSASWDCTLKLWDPNRRESVSTYYAHAVIAYSAVFSPKIPNMFASVGGDGYLKLWSNLTVSRPVFSVKTHDAEVLTCDWNKFNQNLLATGGSDGLIRIFDVRNLGDPVRELQGHELAVRKIQFSPFDEHSLASVGYDYTTRIWDCRQDSELEVIKNHSEFTYGLDWNALRRNELADCGWDSLVHVFVPKCLHDK